MILEIKVLYDISMTYTLHNGKVNFAAIISEQCI